MDVLSLVHNITWLQVVLNFLVQKAGEMEFLQRQPQKWDQPSGEREPWCFEVGAEGH